MSEVRKTLIISSLVLGLMVSSVYLVTQVYDFRVTFSEKDKVNNEYESLSFKFNLLLNIPDDNLLINVDQCGIHNSMNEKLLGVTFDNKLTFRGRRQSILDVFNGLCPLRSGPPPP